MGYMCTEVFALSVLNVSQRLLALFGISAFLASVVAPEVSHEALVEWWCLVSPLL